MLHTRNNDQWHSTAVRSRIGKGRIFSWGRRTNTSVAITSTLFVEVATVILCSLSTKLRTRSRCCVLWTDSYISITYSLLIIPPFALRRCKTRPSAHRKIQVTEAEARVVQGPTTTSRVQCRRTLRGGPAISPFFIKFFSTRTTSSGRRIDSTERLRFTCVWVRKIWHAFTRGSQANFKERDLSTPIQKSPYRVNRQYI